ncbi:MAG: phospholipase [Bacteroidia bacterium]|nr:phospholipase [Bacteroidia bacterium]
MEMLKHELQTRRTARYFTLGELTPQTSHIWFVLHGYGQLASYFIKNFESLAGKDHFIVAPEGMSRFYLGENKWDRVGASWMTKEDRIAEISDQIAFLDKVFDQFAGYIQINQAKVSVLGFSQGTATVWRWLRDGRVKADNLVLWAGSIPSEFSAEMAEKLFRMKLYIAYGSRDEYLNDENVKKQLDELGTIKPDFEVIKFEDGHRIPEDALAELVSRMKG